MTSISKTIKTLEKSLGCKIFKVNPDDIIHVRHNRINEHCINKNLFLPLSPIEVFSICDKLNISSNAFIDSYCDIMFDKNTGIPLVIFAKNGCCFNENNFCTLKESKPNSCSIYPLIRIRNVDNDLKDDFSYYISENNKNFIGEPKRLSTWLKENNFENRHINSIKYQNFIFKIVNIFDFNKLNICSKLSNSQKCLINSSILDLLFMNYEPNNKKNNLQERYERVYEFLNNTINTFPFLKSELKSEANNE